MAQDDERPAIAPLLLDRIDASTALRISDRTLRELVKSGDIETVRIGTRLLFPVSALEDYVDRLLAANRNGSPRRRPRATTTTKATTKATAAKVTKATAVKSRAPAKRTKSPAPVKAKRARTTKRTRR